MCTAPFIINTMLGKILMCIGLACLTLQTYGLKAYNIVFVNVVGILGYMFAIFT